MLTSMQVVQAVVGRALEKCPVCGAIPHIFDPSYVPDSVGVVSAVRLRVRCHGSFVTADIAIDQGAREHIATQVFDFMERLFSDEARSPDLRELIAYNRGALPC